MSGPGRWLSVIVPTYNSASCLRGALESLAAQDERGFEVVVSDGASRDDTLNIAHGCAAGLPALTVLSRPDGGVYDAINRALPACSGRWVYVMGSDDRLHAPQTLAQVARAVAQTPASLVYGDVRVIGANSMVADGARYGGPFTLARLMGQNICQQAVFYRRDIFDRLGDFDVRFRLWSDWDFAQRAFFTEATQWLDVVIADYAATGISTGAQDTAFIATRRARLLALWRTRPFSLAVPKAMLRQSYWDLRKRIAT